MSGKTLATCTIDSDTITELFKTQRITERIGSRDERKAARKAFKEAFLKAIEEAQAMGCFAVDMLMDLSELKSDEAPYDPICPIGQREFLVNAIAAAREAEKGRTEPQASPFQKTLQMA